MATLTAYVCPVLLRRGRERLQRRRTREHRIAREQASAEVARKASDEAAAARKREIETKASVMKDLLGTVRIVPPVCACASMCASLCTSKCARVELRCCNYMKHDVTRDGTDRHTRRRARTSDGRPEFDSAGAHRGHDAVHQAVCERSTRLALPRSALMSLRLFGIDVIAPFRAFLAPGDRFTLAVLRVGSRIRLFTYLFVCLFSGRLFVCSQGG